MVVIHDLVLDVAWFKTDCHWNRTLVVYRKHGHWIKYSNTNISLVYHFLFKNQNYGFKDRSRHVHSSKPTTSFGKRGVWSLLRLLHWWRSEAVLVRTTVDVEPASSDFWDSTGNHPACWKRAITAISCTYLLKPFALIPHWHLFSLLCSIIIHPCKDILVSCSEDRLWKVVGFPKGNVLLTGFGHTDWLSDCSLHPRSVHTTWETAQFLQEISCLVSSLCWLWLWLFSLQLHALQRI